MLVLSCEIGPPDDFCFDLSFRVRSGEIACHDAPSSSERNRTLAPAYRAHFPFVLNGEPDKARPTSGTVMPASSLKSSTAAPRSVSATPSACKPQRSHLAGPATDERLTAEIETTIYRLAQEALNNVAKHARATLVDVVLERRPATLSLIIEDNGVGFDPAGVDGAGQHLGLIGMRERAALLGAEFQIESSPGRGTTVILRTPATPRAIENP